MKFLAAASLLAILTQQYGVTERALEIQRLRVMNDGRFGNYLGDQTGKPLYIFDQDQRGASSAKPQSKCYGSCARTWQPVTGKPEQTSTATGALALFNREDQQQQLSYDGWPLYYYSVDIGGGSDPSGNGKIDHGGTWSLLRPDGTPVAALPK
ncbi:MAG TPA: hypothetical protein VNR88_10300 [Hyphomicrobium sp.]|nr:hypothetical protein [Hyphomicrobium sp.]